MSSSEPPAEYPNDLAWTLAATFGAVLLASIRLPFQTHYISLLATAIQNPATSLHDDLLVKTALHSAYGLGPKALAYACARLSALLGVSLPQIISIFFLMFWSMQAAFAYRFFLALSGNRAAACLAALFVGLDVPLFMSDTPYALQKLERSLGMIPLLWALKALLERRRWPAVAGIAASTYLHALPAMYLWPLLFLDIAWQAWNEPRERIGAALSLLTATAMALPLFLGIGGSLPAASWGAAFARLCVLWHKASISGIGYSKADTLMQWEGWILLAMAAWRARRLPTLPFILRAFATCVGLLALGTTVYSFCPTESFLFRIVSRLQPWHSLFILDITGQVLLALWILEEMSDGTAAWPAFLLILVFSARHDFIVRSLGIGVGACLLFGPRRGALVFAAAAAALPFLYAAAPVLFKAFAFEFGLRGRFFFLPAFDMVSGGVFIAAILLGLWFEREVFYERPTQATSIAVAVLILLYGLGDMCRWKLPTSSALSPEGERMALWLRQDTPPAAVVLASPIDAIRCTDFMTVAQRSLFACRDYAEMPIVFGAAALPMGERLAALGFDFNNPNPDVNAYLDEQVQRAYKAMTLEKAAALLAGMKNPGYVMVAGEPPWAAPVLHREGEFVVYAAPRIGRRGGSNE